MNEFIDTAKQFKDDSNIQFGTFNDEFNDIPQELVDEEFDSSLIAFTDKGPVAYTGPFLSKYLITFARNPCEATAHPILDEEDKEEEEFFNDKVEL